MDELPEFKHPSLEVLRGPMEDRRVSISRVQANFTYPCNFMLVASMNPCPCGYFGDKDRKCKCTENQIHHYQPQFHQRIIQYQVMVSKSRMK